MIFTIVFIATLATLFGAYKLYRSLRAIAARLETENDRFGPVDGGRWYGR